MGRCDYAPGWPNLSPFAYDERQIKVVTFAESGI